MTTRRDFLKKGGIGLAALAVQPSMVFSSTGAIRQNGGFVSKRPAAKSRHFTSQSVEKAIQRVSSKIKDPKLKWMFGNCFPNTLDTTVNYSVKNGKPDTFVITGDIEAMWLRDSSAQVWPYVPLTKDDAPLKRLIAGVIRRQTQCILIDPYANAFYADGKAGGGEWMSDKTDMKPELHERKWEIDSLCYPIRLAYHYWKTTGDTSVFDADWKRAMALVVKTFKEQQRKDGLGPYSFLRVTDRALDTVPNDGYGHPVNPVGLIVSTFRPSDDASTFGFLVPSNLFAVTSLREVAELSEKVTQDKSFSLVCTALADEVQQAIETYAITTHPKYGRVYAFEVDGFGNTYFMDDANVPSLLALPYLGAVDKNDEVYQNTRRLVLSGDNPYFFKGTAGEGIGGPHIGYDMIWPMSIIMRAMTSSDDKEIAHCLQMLRDTDGDTGFMHESFHKDNPKKFTRTWFAWVNTLFGELILKLDNENKLHLLPA
ncbi:MAG TPA: metal-independent alpha-mannosidase [Porphyromonadaceae bacterium]|nr:metal-independent alpha-mannosidase [Porphyromonadaceae bacterium]HBK30293.1 metal-independent alpha-mannosidase [Porphyromonadaceae bacterium]HBL34824.1 metal-independent alpha-mannosidase [Porphyromonadaceae bacterium]